jgi:hypothetical protein
MVFFEWANLLSSPKKHLHTSTPNALSYCSKPDSSIYRERREHKIFETLMQMVPGLVERLLEGSDESLVHIGELVFSFLFKLL